jgi:hypothetical protein
VDWAWVWSGNLRHHPFAWQVQGEAARMESEVAVAGGKLDADLECPIARLAAELHDDGAGAE